MFDVRIQIKLSPQEWRALIRLAEVERRDERDQASIMVRDELQRRSLLDRAPASTQPKEGERDAATVEA